MTRTIFVTTVLTVMVFISLTQPAFAYIDAGTGSLILQALLGGLVGFTAFLKLYWYQVKEFFAKLTGKCEEKPEEAEEISSEPAKNTAE